MRIAYISISEIPSRTANSIHVMKMCQAFANAGHEVTLYAFGPDVDKQEDVYGFYGVKKEFRITKCHYPRLRGVGNWIYANRVSRMIRSRPADLLYSRDVYGLISAASKGIPMIYEAHAPPRTKYRRTIEAHLFRKQSFKKLVTISDALKQEYLRVFPWLSGDSILVAHDGADPAKPELILRDDSVPSRSNSHRLQVGYVGHLYSGKGMETIAPLARAMPEMDFHIVGGTESDLRYWRAELDENNVTFHGFVPHSEVGVILHSLDVALAPYQARVSVAGGKGDVARWMSPLKLFEYMAHGKAIVVSDLPVIREVLEHGQDALMVPWDSVDQWVGALHQLRSEDLRIRLGESAKNKFLQRYTWSSRAAWILSSL